jgi:Ion channel
VRTTSKFTNAIGGKFGILLIALIVLLVASPVLVERPSPSVVLILFGEVVLVASLHAAQPGGTAVMVGLILALVDFAIGRLVAIDDALWLCYLQAILWLVTLVYVATTILQSTFKSEKVSVETLQASLCVYLLLGLIWVFVYALIDLTAPGSFVSTDPSRLVTSRRSEFMRLVVFSYATMVCTGYGDLTPGNGFANMCASLQAMTGQIYLAVVIARLVGIQSSQSISDQAARAVETAVVVKSDL